MYTKKFIFIIPLCLTYNITAMNSDAPKTTLVGFINGRQAITGKTSLHLAAERGSINDIQFYLEQKANINTQDYFGNTPLYYAIKNQRQNAALLLIKQGANVSIRNHDNIYPTQLLYNWDEGKKTNLPTAENIFKQTVLAAIIYHKTTALYLEELQKKELLIFTKKYSEKLEKTQWQIAHAKITMQLNKAISNKKLTPYKHLLTRKRAQTIWSIAATKIKTNTATIKKCSKKITLSKTE